MCGWWLWWPTWHDTALGHVEQQGEALAREGVVEVVVVVVTVLVQDLGGVLRHPALSSRLAIKLKSDNMDKIGLF